jgi:hypothetical protein
MYIPDVSVCAAIVGVRVRAGFRFAATISRLSVGPCQTCVQGCKDVAQPFEVLI